MPWPVVALPYPGPVRVVSYIGARATRLQVSLMLFWVSCSAMIYKNTLFFAIYSRLPRVTWLASVHTLLTRGQGC